jgi:hypothetical protein
LFSLFVPFCIIAAAISVQVFRDSPILSETSGFSRDQT